MGMAIEEVAESPNHRTLSYDHACKESTVPRNFANVSGANAAARTANASRYINHLINIHVNTIWG